MTSGGPRGTITDLLIPPRFGNTQTRPLCDVIFPSLSMTTPSAAIHCSLQERPEYLETWPYHLNFPVLTVVSKSLYGSIACFILLRTSSFMTCSVYDNVVESSVASHLHCLYSWLKDGGECPRFACIQKN